MIDFIGFVFTLVLVFAGVALVALNIVWLARGGRR